MKYGSGFFKGRIRSDPDPGQLRPDPQPFIFGRDNDFCRIVELIVYSNFCGQFGLFSLY